MSIQTRTIEYKDGSVVLEAYMAWEDGGNDHKPAVLISHAWGGRSESSVRSARRPSASVHSPSSTRATRVSATVITPSPFKRCASEPTNPKAAGEGGGDGDEGSGEGGWGGEGGEGGEGDD